MLFRNSEYISSVLGRSVTNENFISFNLEKDSMFRNLRIMTYRKNIKDFENMDINDTESVIKTIDSINKEVNLNLIVLNINDRKQISQKLEKYLIDLNKKILLISKEEIQFKTYF